MLRAGPFQAQHRRAAAPGPGNIKDHPVILILVAQLRVVFLHADVRTQGFQTLLAALHSGVHGTDKSHLGAGWGGRQIHYCERQSCNQTEGKQSFHHSSCLKRKGPVGPMENRESLRLMRLTVELILEIIKHDHRMSTSYAMTL